VEEGGLSSTAIGASMRWNEMSAYWTRQLSSTKQELMASRSFLARAYPTMKKNNPNTPIMIREAAGTQPRVYARYGE
jgi:hypothetical protein